MNTLGTSLVVALLLVGLTTALPNVLHSYLEEKQPDARQPENTMMGQKLKELGIEICPDKLHLCPGTATCCKRNGRWDCCPIDEDRQMGTSTVSGDCCHQLGFIWTCCTSLVPKCHWWGCWWT